MSVHHPKVHAGKGGITQGSHPGVLCSAWSLYACQPGAKGPAVSLWDSEECYKVLPKPVTGSALLCRRPTKRRRKTRVRELPRAPPFAADFLSKLLLLGAAALM